MSDPEMLLLAQQWMTRAEEDLLTAEHMLMLEQNCPCSIVCFHSQQCAEKYLKAVLTWLRVHFRRTHDLFELLSLIPPDSGLALASADLGTLNRYAVETRYPGETEPISRAEADRAVRQARQVREAVRRLLPPERL